MTTRHKAAPFDFFPHYNHYNSIGQVCRIGYNGFREVITLPSQKPFLSFVIGDELLRQIDDFRFQHRFDSRAATIKWLLDWALQQKPKPPNGKGQVK